MGTGSGSRIRRHVPTAKSRGRTAPARHHPWCGKVGLPAQRRVTFEPLHRGARMKYVPLLTSATAQFIPGLNRDAQPWRSRLPPQTASGASRSPRWSFRSRQGHVRAQGERSAKDGVHRARRVDWCGARGRPARPSTPFPRGRRSGICGTKDSWSATHPVPLYGVTRLHLRPGPLSHIGGVYRSPLTLPPESKPSRNSI